MPKKSKWVVVATEGATTDGRAIERRWIEEAAESYDPKNTYGARLNLDHIKFTLYMPEMANSHCFGDVLALKAEEREDGKLQLLAQIQPTDALIELNKKGQKVYTSIEIDTNFADTGKAYLVGLAVTDNPASLGTEMLAFSHNGLSSRKLKAENLFSAAVETAFEFSEEKPSILAQVKALFARKAEEEKAQKEEEGFLFADMQQSILLLSERLAELEEKLTQQETAFAALQTAHTALQAMVEEFDQQPAANYTPRPRVAGEKKETDGRFF